MTSQGMRIEGVELPGDELNSYALLEYWYKTPTYITKSEETFNTLVKRFSATLEAISKSTF
jgi:hypothetical protein